ncbi:MAG: helix-turn-helix domain-containing protein [Phycisphaerales bacterium]
MHSGLTGNQIRAMREAFGLSIGQFAQVLGVHPVTLNRWELAGKQCPPIDGLPRSILMGLQGRLEQARSQRRFQSEAAKAGSEIEKMLALGGVLVALAALLAFLSG